MSALRKLQNKLIKSFSKDKSHVLYICGGLLLFITFVLIKILPEWPILTGTLLLIASVLLMTGFLFWHVPFLYKIWSKELGKVGLSIVHIFILLISTICARNLITLSVGLPGKDFQLSLSLLTFILYLPVWLFIISIIFGVGFYLIGLFSSQDKAANGHFLGSFGTLVILYFLYLLAVNNENLHSMVRVLVFYSDYESAPNYPEIKQNERVTFHENGVVSSAWYSNGDVVISVRKMQ